MLTDQRGLSWTVDGNAEWKLTWNDLVALETRYPIHAERLGETVYALTRLGGRAVHARSFPGVNGVVPPPGRTVPPGDAAAVQPRRPRAAPSGGSPRPSAR